MAILRSQVPLLKLSRVERGGGRLHTARGAPEASEAKITGNQFPRSFSALPLTDLETQCRHPLL